MNKFIVSIVLITSIVTIKITPASGDEAVRVFHDGRRFVARVIFRKAGAMGITKFILEKASDGEVVDSKDVAATNIRRGQREDFWYNLPEGVPIGAFILKVETEVVTRRDETFFNGRGQLKFRKTGEVPVKRNCRQIWDHGLEGAVGPLTVCDR